MDKRKLEILKRLQTLDDKEVNDIINEGKEETNHEVRRRFAGYEKNGWLRFDQERVYKLAEGFKNPQQMINYKGENQDQIRSAGYLIMGHKAERPEWFDEIEKRETKEEVLKKARKYKGWFHDMDYSLQQKLWRYYDKKELRNLLPNIKWSRVYWTDDMIYQQLLKYEDVKACRKSPDKGILTKLQVDKGENYPESYALYRSKLVGHSGPRSKRGSYAQRDPLIQQWSKDGQLLGEFTWEQIVNDLGYKRSSITGALKGINGQKTAKGYIWKFKK